MKRPSHFPSIVTVLISFAAALAATMGALMVRCTSDGLVCNNGLTRCGQSCNDLTSDRRNCGVCGTACQLGQICVNSNCVCEPGTMLCNGVCSEVLSDVLNCGGCAGDGGVSCAANQVCANGMCKFGCTIGTSSCQAPLSCHAGVCSYDIVVACPTNGQVVGIQAITDVTDSGVPVGLQPQALATLPRFPANVLLVADGAWRQLLQARLSDYFVFPQADAGLGAGPSHIWAEDPFLYVVNADGDSLQILQRVANLGPPDAGNAGPVALTQVSQLNFAAGSSPQAIAKVNASLYIPLRGGASSPSAGQKVVQINVADPSNPSIVQTFDLTQLRLPSFDGGIGVPRPSGIAARGDGGLLYVPLNNLGPAPSSDPNGPGLLAKIDTRSNTISTVDLGANACLNARWVVGTADALYASCGGKVTLNGSVPVSTDRTAIVTLGLQDQPIASWSPTCAAGTACAPASLGRFAAFGSRLYIGDQLSGQVFVIEKVGGQLLERRGYATDAGPIPACPPKGSPVSVVSDVISVP